MTIATDTSTSPHTHQALKALGLALRLAHAENALLALTSGQVDAIVDPDGKTYLLRPAQEHLMHRERQLRALIDSIADVITVVNQGGVILSQNDAVRRVLGYRSDELVGINLFELIRKDDWAAVHSKFFNVIEGFNESATVEFHHRVPDGSYRPMAATMSKMRDTSGERIILSLRPISSTPVEGAEAASRFNLGQLNLA
jgi:PAS domain S-box-containing protein